MNLNISQLLVSATLLVSIESGAQVCKLDCAEELIKNSIRQNLNNLPYGRVEVEYRPMKDVIASFTYENGRFLFTFDPSRFIWIQEVKRAVNHEMIHAWNAREEVSPNPHTDTSPINKTGLSFSVIDTSQRIYNNATSYTGHEILAFRTNFLFSFDTSQEMLSRNNLCEANIWYNNAVNDMFMWDKLAINADRIIKSVRPELINDYSTLITTPFSSIASFFDIPTQTSRAHSFSIVGARTQLRGFSQINSVARFTTLENRFNTNGLGMDYYNRYFPDPSSAAGREKVLSPYLDVIGIPQNRAEISRTQTILPSIYPDSNGSIETLNQYAEKLLQINLNTRIQVPWIGPSGIDFPEYIGAQAMAEATVAEMNRRFYAQCATIQCAPAAQSSYPLVVDRIQEFDGLPNVFNRKISVWIRNNQGQILFPEVQIQPVWQARTKSTSGQAAILPGHGPLLSGQPVYQAPCLGLYF